jgi:hypothetical protein
MSPKSSSYILYWFPGAATYPESVEASSRRPCPYRMSLLASTPRLNVKFCQRIVSFNSMLWDSYSDSIGAWSPSPCCWNVTVK